MARWTKEFPSSTDQVLVQRLGDLSDREAKAQKTSNRGRKPAVPRISVSRTVDPTRHSSGSWEKIKLPS